MSLIENILQEHQGEDIVFPAKFMESELLQELEEKLERGNAAEVKIFYRDLPEKIDYDQLDDLTERIDRVGKNHITEGDEVILDFFSTDNSKATVNYFLRISGVLVNILSLSDELEETESVPKNIEASAYLWTYLNIYEIILGNMTQFLHKYYMQEDNDDQVNYIEGKLDEGEHLTAGKIESHLSSTIGVLSEDNDSILSESGSKLLRNKVGHANIYYDDAVDEFILTDGERYSFEEFLEEYKVLLQFTTEWLLKLNLGIGEGDQKINETIKQYFEILGNKAGKGMIEIERSDENLRDIVLKYKED